MITTQPTATPRAIFMMGGPASGKSTVRQRLFAGITVVDSDAIKATHPDYNPADPSALHAWSSTEATRAFYAALSTGQDVVFDGTGSNAEKYVAFINAAHAAGYLTEVVYVTTDLGTAIARNAARARVVPEAIVREKHAALAVAVDIVAKYAGSIRIIKN